MFDETINRDLGKLLLFDMLMQSIEDSALLKKIQETGHKSRNVNVADLRESADWVSSDLGRDTIKLLLPGAQVQAVVAEIAEAPDEIMQRIKAYRQSLVRRVADEPVADVGSGAMDHSLAFGVATALEIESDDGVDLGCPVP